MASEMPPSAGHTPAGLGAERLTMETKGLLHVPACVVGEGREGTDLEAGVPRLHLARVQEQGQDGMVERGGGEGDLAARRQDACTPGGLGREAPSISANNAVLSSSENDRPFPEQVPGR